MRCNALHGHQTALITSGCVSFRGGALALRRPDRPARAGKAARKGSVLKQQNSAFLLEVNAVPAQAAAEAEDRGEAGRRAAGGAAGAAVAALDEAGALAAEVAVIQGWQAEYEKTVHTIIDMVEASVSPAQLADLADEHADRLDAAEAGLADLAAGDPATAEHIARLEVELATLEGKLTSAMDTDLQSLQELDKSVHGSLTELGDRLVAAEAVLKAVQRAGEDGRRATDGKVNAITVRVDGIKAAAGEQLSAVRGAETKIEVFEARIEMFKATMDSKLLSVQSRAPVSWAPDAAGAPGTAAPAESAPAAIAATPLRIRPALGTAARLPGSSAGPAAAAAAAASSAASPARMAAASLDGHGTISGSAATQMAGQQSASARASGLGSWKAPSPVAKAWWPLAGSNPAPSPAGRTPYGTPYGTPKAEAEGRDRTKTTF